MSGIRVIKFDRTSGNAQPGGEELLDQIGDNENAWVWVDISGSPSGEKDRILRELFEIPQLAIQDANRSRHPPKLEHIGDNEFLMLRDIVEVDGDEQAVVKQLSFFIGLNFMITVHAEDSPSVEKAWADAQTSKELAARGPAHLTYRLTRNIVDAYTPIVLGHEEALAEIEDAIFSRSDDATVEELSGLNRILRRMRRNLVYQAKVVDQLRQHNADSILPFDEHELNDIYENMDRLATLCQLNQELAVDLLNTHLSVVSHRLNVVMRVLTVATIVFLPLGLLAGIYGMNFQVMPELSWEYGYFVVLGLMIALVVTLISFFRRKNWL